MYNNLNCRAEVVGKPSPAFFQLALEGLGQGLELGQVIMIGDDVRDDVLGKSGKKRHDLE